jgi:hypothetical protein
VGCGAASVGDWCPKFRERILFSSSRAECPNVKQQAPTQVVPHPRRTETIAALERKPKDTDCIKESVTSNRCVSNVDPPTYCLRCQSTLYWKLDTLRDPHVRSLRKFTLGNSHTY